MKAQTGILTKFCVYASPACERGINSVFTCCLKHISDRKNKSNDFNDFFSSVSPFFAIIKSFTTYVCGADEEHACYVPCLRAEACTCMRNGTLDNGGGW